MVVVSRLGPPTSVGILLGVLLAASAPPPASAQPHGPPSPAGLPAGLSVNDPRAYPGYSLLAPMNSTETYLMDMDSRVVKTWKSDCTPGMSAYLLPTGHLLRAGSLRGAGPSGPGAGGRIQEFSWDGEVLWDFTVSTQRIQPHHDICPLPNGNVLVIAWDRKSRDEALAAGRRPELTSGQFLPDCLLEIRPTGKTTGETVWEWHAWDHLIQDSDKTKPNYGDISEHPERIDINYSQNIMAGLLRDPDQLAKLRALGYVGGGAPAGGAAPGPGGPGPQGGPGLEPDWMHTNAVDYNAELDQIMLSIHEFSEVWIIDHGTTTAQAASHTGGRRGKGGDLLYRWGNPRAYRNGTHADQRLFAQHNAHWIPPGLPGAGHMLVFNNGNGRPDGVYSSVDEVVLPLNKDGLYTREEYLAFGPERAIWSYTAPEKSSFFSMTVSGAHRLPNGNTFICSGNAGILFEVTPAKETVWQYTNPTTGFGGFGPGEMGFQLPRPGEVLPTFLQDVLEMTAAQKEQLAKLQQQVDGELDKILTEPQQTKLEDMSRGLAGGPGFGPPGFGPPRFGMPGFGPPGFGLPGFGPPGSGPQVPDPNRPDGQATRTGPSAVPRDPQDDSKTPRGDAVLAKSERRKPGRDGDGAGRGPGRGFGGGPGGFGGLGGPGGPGGLFRSYRYGADYPGLAGQDLTPGDKLEALLNKRDD